MDKQIGLLIKTLNGTIKQLPSAVKLMVHQYTIKSIVFAAIFGILALVLVGVALYLLITTVRTVNVAGTEYRMVEESYGYGNSTKYKKEFPSDDFGNHLLALWGAGISTFFGLFFFTYAMLNLGHALNPIISLISILKG